MPIVYDLDYNSAAVWSAPDDRTKDPEQVEYKRMMRKQVIELTVASQSADVSLGQIAKDIDRAYYFPQISNKNFSGDGSDYFYAGWYQFRKFVFGQGDLFGGGFVGNKRFHLTQAEKPLPLDSYQTSLAFGYIDDTGRRCTLLLLCDEEKGKNSSPSWIISIMKDGDKENLSEREVKIVCSDKIAPGFVADKKHSHKVRGNAGELISKLIGSQVVAEKFNEVFTKDGSAVKVDAMDQLKKNALIYMDNKGYLAFYKFFSTLKDDKLTQSEKNFQSRNGIAEYIELKKIFSDLPIESIENFPVESMMHSKVESFIKDKTQVLRDHLDLIIDNVVSLKSALEESKVQDSHYVSIDQNSLVEAKSTVEPKTIEEFRARAEAADNVSRNEITNKAMNHAVLLFCTHALVKLEKLRMEKRDVQVESKVSSGSASVETKNAPPKESTRLTMGAGEQAAPKDLYLTNQAKAAPESHDAMPAGVKKFLATFAGTLGGAGVGYLVGFLLAPVTFGISLVLAPLVFGLIGGLLGNRYKFSPVDNGESTKFVSQLHMPTVHEDYPAELRPSDGRTSQLKEKAGMRGSVSHSKISDAAVQSQSTNASSSSLSGSPRSSASVSKDQATGTPAGEDSVQKDHKHVPPKKVK